MATCLAWQACPDVPLASRVCRLVSYANGQNWLCDSHGPEIAKSLVRRVQIHMQLHSLARLWVSAPPALWIAQALSCHKLSWQNAR